MVNLNNQMIDFHDLIHDIQLVDYSYLIVVEVSFYSSIDFVFDVLEDFLAKLLRLLANPNLTHQSIDVIENIVSTTFPNHWRYVRDRYKID